LSPSQKIVFNEIEKNILSNSNKEAENIPRVAVLIAEISIVPFFVY